MTRRRRQVGVGRSGGRLDNSHNACRDRSAHSCLTGAGSCGAVAGLTGSPGQQALSLHARTSLCRDNKHECTLIINKAACEFTWHCHFIVLRMRVMDLCLLLDQVRGRPAGHVAAAGMHAYDAQCMHCLAPHRPRYVHVPMATRGAQLRGERGA